MGGAPGPCGPGMLSFESCGGDGTQEERVRSPQSRLFLLWSFPPATLFRGPYKQKTNWQREVRGYAQNHRAGKWQSGELNPGSLAPLHAVLRFQTQQGMGPLERQSVMGAGSSLPFPGLRCMV